MSGLLRLLEEVKRPLPAGSIGFLGHRASVLPDGTHAVDVLRTQLSGRITRLFSPEHGFFSQAAAGEKVGNSRHSEWDIPLFSLYGEHRCPPADTLQDLDLFVIDLQDLGVRCYTYASTLDLVLKACAAIRLPVWILDRPIPLAGVEDGPVLDPAFTSFVGRIPLPLVYGKTPGQLAQFLQHTDPLLSELDLTVFTPLSEQVAQPWVPPSPGIVSPESGLLYPLTVWCEAIPRVWVDRNGPLSFQCWAMPDLPDPGRFSEWTLPGIEVEFDHFPTPEGRWPGLRFRVSDRETLRPVTAALQLLKVLSDTKGPGRLFKDKGARPRFFDQLMGTSAVREALMKDRNSVK